MVRLVNQRLHLAGTPPRARLLGVLGRSLCGPNQLWFRMHFPSFHGQRAAQADVRHAGIRRAAVPGAGPVARAVSVVAEEGPAFLYSQRTVRLTRVETLFGSCRVDYHVFAGSLTVQVDLIPVAAPLPDVA